MMMVLLRWKRALAMEIVHENDVSEPEHDDGLVLAAAAAACAIRHVAWLARYPVLVCVIGLFPFCCLALQIDET